MVLIHRRVLLSGEVPVVVSTAGTGDKMVVRHDREGSRQSKKSHSSITVKTNVRLGLSTYSTSGPVVYLYTTTTKDLVERLPPTNQGSPSIPDRYLPQYIHCLCHYFRLFHELSLAGMIPRLETTYVADRQPTYIAHRHITSTALSLSLCLSLYSLP